jgi:hypothetical protein
MATSERRAWRDEDGTVRPWEVPGNVRRDRVPHRGLLLTVFGGAALFCGFAAFFLMVPALISGLAAAPMFSGFAVLYLMVPALIAMPLGIAVARMARRDLDRMRSGAMDPDGRRQAVRAQLWGTVGGWLCILSWAPLMLLYLALL